MQEIQSDPYESPALVVFAVGNLSRGDDGLGPALLDRLQHCLPSGTKTVCDFQLQVEDALELKGAGLALFIDAALGLTTAFEFRELHPCAGQGAFSHALEPSAVLDVFARIEGRPPPPAFALGIRAMRFGLGEDLSEQAIADLDAALQFARELVERPDAASWRTRAEDLRRQDKALPEA